MGCHPTIEVTLACLCDWWRELSLMVDHNLYVFFISKRREYHINRLFLIFKGNIPFSEITQVVLYFKKNVLINLMPTFTRVCIFAISNR